MTKASREMMKPEKTVLFNLAYSLNDPQEFRETLQLDSMLDTLYYGSLVCEFARDVVWTA